MLYDITTPTTLARGLNKIAVNKGFLFLKSQIAPTFSCFYAPGQSSFVMPF